MKVELRVTAGPAAGQQFTFEQPDCFLFGRSEDAHISLPNDPYVSRQHFLLEISPPDCKLTDLNSKNGVFVNGIRYGGKKAPPPGIQQAANGIKEVQLQDGDVIIVGDTRIQIIIDGLPVPSSSTTPSPHVSSSIPRISGYQIEQEIGQGKMGTVYKAREQKTGTLVAVKLISPRTAIESDKIRRFERELELLKQLRHNHIVRLLDYGQIKERFYFIIEFVEGIDLATLLRQKGGRLRIEEAAPIMLSALEGLAYAHRVKITMRTAKGESKTFRGIVHQDLKPQNILLTRRQNSWLAKISDFGLAKGFESSGFTNITSPEDILRTPVYWPREQITHYASPVPPTDVFALAAIFYEMLSGHWVREGFRELLNRTDDSGKYASISEYLTVILANAIIPIRHRLPGIPVPLANVLDRALRETELPQNPAKMREVLSHLRYPDAAVFQKALSQAFNMLKDTGSLPHNHQSPLSPSPEPRPENASSSGAVVYSTITPTKQKTVALLVMDLEQSTRYVVNKGDTSFSTLIGNMYRRIKNHEAALELIFLKCTGDGFLLVFQAMPAACSLAVSFLETPVHGDIKIRMALHWGQVKTGPDGDVLGAEVHRVSRIEGVKGQDRIDSAKPRLAFPEANRILITRQGLAQLPRSDQVTFQAVGTFHLKGFEDPCEIWIFTGNRS